MARIRRQYEAAADDTAAPAPATDWTRGLDRSAERLPSKEHAL